jgi:hypothetical protein
VIAEKRTKTTKNKTITKKPLNKPNSKSAKKAATVIGFKKKAKSRR